MSDPSTFNTSTGTSGDNEIAVETISERLSEVTGLAEELDQALKSAQQDCSVLTSTSTSTTADTVITPIITLKRFEDCNSEFKPVKPDELKSDDEFQTASDCTLQHSRSSSYNTASECENRYSPWWEFDKNINENLSKEKMILAVGLPTLPLAQSVLKPSPEVPPGKIVHEVTETTHLKVQHSHTMGVQSFVLTSETVRDKNNEGYVQKEELVKVTNESGQELLVPVQVSKNIAEDDFVKRMRECGDWLQLKILEITPELASLGATLSEALELQSAHDEVLKQLQNKQSPVEELLRQADELIATQKPRAEVYAAMAESLGRAWKNINFNLELRKQILDLNVQYHTKAQEFYERIDRLEESCTDTVIPIEVEAVKSFLTSIHELRRTLLESLMAALQAGNSLLGKLKDLGTEGTLDSRPDRIRVSVNKAISQVQGWLDELHMRRQDVEATFNRRKSQLEQCLALAMLAVDLRELEEKVIDSRTMLANTDQLGDSSSSAELLQHEHKKLHPEAKQLQERALKITKATEQLLASGCFAGEEATKQSYAILSATSDYLSDLQSRDILLDRVIAFFRSAQTALNKLDQLEIQLTNTELPSTSPQLVQLHSQCAKTIEAITTAPIAEGHAILDQVGRGRMGTEGVRRHVEELENKKISLEGLCVAHREENIRINKAVNNFYEQYNDLSSWLITIAEAFLQGHQNMGTDLRTSQDFLALHNQLLNDLQSKGNEINALLLTLPPILEYLEDNQRKDVDGKVENLHERWMKLKNVLETRLDLGRIYLKFHTEADIVNKEMDKLEQFLLSAGSNIDDDTMRNLEFQLESLEPLYQSAKNTGLTFINQADKVSEPHLDTKRACICVESVLERLAGRQLLVTRTWQTFHTDIVEKREVLVRLEETMAESTRTINWVTKLDAQLYPVITINSSSPEDISSFLDDKLHTVLPDIKRAQLEVEQRIKTAETLIARAQTTDEKTLNVKNKLGDLNQKLIEITTDYQILLQMMVPYFNNLSELDRTTEKLNVQFDKVGYPMDISDVMSLIREHEASKQAVLDMFKFAQNECDQLIQRINRQEPTQAAEHDIQKLKHILELRRATWENQCRQRRESLDAHSLFCRFDADLKEIDNNINDLDRQLHEIRGRCGKSLTEAKAASDAYGNFEQTVQALDRSIRTFIQTGEKLLADRHAQSPQIQKHTSELQDKWNKFKRQLEENKHLVELSIQYFHLVNEADEWFKEGSRLLISIARRSTTIKRPEEAEVLLNEIQMFLRPGEEKQTERIRRIKQLAEQIYGPDLSKQLNQVLSENKEMLESFSIISNELSVLTRNLLLAEEEKIRAQKAQEEADAKLAAARAEALAAQEAAAAAEKERRAIEEAARKTAEEAARRAAEEAARRAAEEEARRAAEEAARKIAEETARRNAEEAARKAAEEVARKATEEAARKAEEEAALKAAEEAARRAAEEKAKAAAIEAARKAAEEEARRAALEAARRAAEEAAELAAKKVAEEAARIALEENARKAAEENERREAMKKSEEEERQRAIEDAGRRAVEAENLTRKIESRVHHIEIQREASPIKVGRRESSPDGVVIEEIQELEAPVFITPLSDAVIQEGGKFKFMCQVTGNPVPVVTWYKAGVSIQNNPDYQTCFDHGLCTLNIEETFAEDSAKYTCKAINAAGYVETTAFLSVKETEPEEQLTPPTFAKLLEPANIKEGSSFQFHCIVQGNPLPNVQWYKNQECIDNSSDYSITYNNGEAILRFDKINIPDKAEYTCKAVNELGTAQSTASLSVSPLVPTQPPTFITSLSNIMARAGQKIKLECEITGLPAPELIWSQNGRPLKESRELKLQREGDKATLLIYEAFPKDAGTYSVNAENIAGEATSVCSVSVKGRLPTETSDSEIASDMEPIKPSIQLPLTNISITEGSRVRLDCVIIGQPEPEVIWYHDDRPVKESTDFQLLFQGDRCSLIIHEAFSEDSGHYKVVALNSAGEASSNCNLTVTPATQAQTAPKPAEEASKPTGNPPKFGKLLADVLVSEGDKVIFEGNVSGEPKPEVKWLLNNFPVNLNDHMQIAHDDQGNIKLEITNVRPDDKGVYTVKATNPTGEAKCFAQLIVKSSKPPEIVKYEELKSAPVFREVFNDKTAFENTPTKFECIVAGKPTPKVKWLFNGEPISGKAFLISTSGDRQVLSISDVTKDNEGNITCVAENEVGSASCAATLSVRSISTITLPDNQLSTQMNQHLESSYLIKREVHTESSTSSMSKMISSSSAAPEPQTQVHSYSAQDSKTFKQVNQQTPEIQESHNVEEFFQINKDQPLVHEKSSSVYSIGGDLETQNQIQTVQHSVLHKPIFKARPPKFVSPVIGKIVDQEANVVLEGIIDGQPSPTVKWTKNGQDVTPSDRFIITWELNRASIEIKNIVTGDGGRYTCTAVNEAGTAVSTADLVVRKTIFPPVFGRRLQAQVIKKGDRIKMEVEVTGTPEPIVTWFKDGTPIEDILMNFKIKSMGNSHLVIIEKAELKHTGRFMVRAVNSGGEAQSIADIAVFEPTPDTMVEVVKTVVFEDVRKHETLTSAADKLSSSVSTPKVEPAKAIIPFTTSQDHLQQFSTSSKSEFSSFSEKKTSQEFKTTHLEHKVPEIPQPQYILPSSEPILEKKTDFEIIKPQNSQIIEEHDKLVEEDGGIETTSISKQSSLQYFVKKIEQKDEPDAVQKEIPIPVQIKPELYRKFEDITPEYKKETLVRTVQPFESFRRVTSQEVTRPEPFAITKEFESSSTSRDVYQEFELKPEPPAEIFYTPVYPKPEPKPVQLFETKVAPPPPPPKPMRTFDEQSYYKETSEQSFKTSSSFSKQVHKEMRAVSPRPEALQMEKLWIPHKEIERPASVTAPPRSEKPFFPRPHSSLSASFEPSADGIAMEKEWAHKFSDIHVEKSWPPTQQEESKQYSSWSSQSTLEKKWLPHHLVKETKLTSEKDIVTEVPLHYVANVSHPLHQCETSISGSSYSKSAQYDMSSLHKEQIIEDRNVKPSEVIKSWPPSQQIIEFQPPSKMYPSMDSLTIRPVSVQDITDEVILEPGPPPEMGYAQPPKERRQSYVEIVEQELERNLEKMPMKVPPGGVRTMPPPQPREKIIAPPLPPKKEQPLAPPIPAKTFKPVEPPKAFITIESKPVEKFPDLEPFPFKPDPEKPRAPRSGPPPTPSKFIKGRFVDSDYESDFESSKISSKWRPCTSDNDEPAYRTVKAPKLPVTGRSRSSESEPLPPSKFEEPPKFQGPPRPEINFEQQRTSSIKKQHFTKHHEIKKVKKEGSPPNIKPCSPPLFIEQVKVPEAPKPKHKTTVDGYMADTDEPFIHQSMCKTEYKHEEKSESRQIFQSSQSVMESSQNLPATRVEHKFPQSKRFSATVSTPKKELTATPIITSFTTEKMSEKYDKQTKLEEFPYKPDPIKQPTVKCPPPPSPSKFVKREFRESDYESDYDGPIPPVWRSSDRDGDLGYKPVRPVLTPSGRYSHTSGRTPTPPTEFEHPVQTGGASRPKFEPIDKFKQTMKLDEILKPEPKTVLFKPKPLPVTSNDLVVATPAAQKFLPLRPGSPPEIAYAPGPQKTQFYRSTTSAPYHNAIQTETSNVMHFNESSESCHRTVSLQQTTKVIKFGDKSKQDLKVEHFPRATTPGTPKIRVPPPSTPKKFVPGEFRESDYESEVESARIKPKWAPCGSDTDELHYRRVRPPSASRSPPRDRVRAAIESNSQSFTTSGDNVDGESSSSYKRFDTSKTGQLVSRSRSYEPPVILKPGSPPEYGYVGDSKMKSTATKLASQHMDSMTQAFKSKTQHFVEDLMTDVSRDKNQKSILKNEDGDAQVYREESRAAQYGTKHIDPDTGLIYFKYDFGYEFGIILPGESKQGGIPVPKKTIIEAPKRTSDIQMPVYHETTKQSNQQPANKPKFQPQKMKTSNKTQKREPTSESELSEYEGEAARRRNIQGPRWEPSSCSPVSLSPSIPSTSPAFYSHLAGADRRKGAETPPSCPSTPIRSAHSAQARAPLFITPLRNIAVVSGQNAKFECIIQSEPPPNILWSKNGRIIEDSNDYQLHYRNGVCRLTISRAYPEDAGTYTCTATNIAGNANTTATLDVPGERLSTYIK